MKHYPLSASASHRWLVCPGSIEANANKGFEQSVYALEGSTAHALLEVALRLGDDPTTFVGQVLEEGLMPADDAMADGVGYAIDYVRAYMVDNPNAHLYIEHKVHYGKSIGCDDEEAGGTSDLVIDNYPKECVVIDYKHGIGVSVSVKQNSQLRLYAVGQRQQRGRYQRYRNVVVQPRVPKRKPVQEVSFTDKELMTWVDGTVRPVVPIALAKDAPRVAGDHCQFCAADGKCKAQYEFVQQAAAKEFKNNDPKSLPPAAIARALTLFSTIERIGAAIKEHAIKQVHAGVKIPGYVKDFTNAKRIWKDEDKATEHLAGLGLDKRERYKVELISPAQAEKVLKGKKLWPKRPRGSAAEDFDDPLAGVVGYTESNPTIRKVD